MCRKITIAGQESRAGFAASGHAYHTPPCEIVWIYRVSQKNQNY